MLKKKERILREIKLKIKNGKKINYKLYNNYMVNNLCSAQRMPNRKLAVDTNNISKPIILDNIIVQNSIIQHNTSELKEQNDFKIKKFSFFRNKEFYKICIDIKIMEK